MGANRHHPLVAAAGLVAIAMAWLLLAPTSVGGRAAYVIINGSSMEPGMHRGDLAVLLTGERYDIGDVVTYRHPTIGPIIHRVIGRDGERYVFQGDNNPFVDTYHPRDDELVGRLWLHIPRAGSLLQTLRQPPVFAALATLVLGTALMTPASPTLRPRRRRAAPLASSEPQDALGLLSGAVTLCAALALAALALAALSFARPTTHQAPAQLAYSQSGSFSYAATAPQGLYDGEGARAGDPIFLQVSELVPVSFTYRFSAEAPTTLAGEARLAAVLSDGAGWRRTFPLGAETHFTGREVTVEGTLDLAALGRAIKTYETLSGAPRGQYELDLSPAVSISGSLAGQPLAASYGSPLRFTLDAKALRPIAGDGGPALLTQETASLSYQREEPTTLALGPLRLAVATARRLALITLEVALAGGLLAGWYLNRIMARDTMAAARLRYGRLLVRAGAGGDWTTGALPLASLDELARLADRLGQPILVVEDGAAARYYVRDGAAVYTSRPGGEQARGELV